MIEIKDELLQKVSGGAIDWKLFGQKFMDSLTQPIGTITIEHKQLVEAIKNKNYIEVAIIANSLLSKGDELVIKLIRECM